MRMSVCVNATVVVSDIYQHFEFQCLSSARELRKKFVCAQIFVCTCVYVVILQAHMSVRECVLVLRVFCVTTRERE